MDGKMFIVYIFDVVEFNGEDLMQKPLIERRAFIPKTDILKPAEFRVIHFPEERAKIFEFFKNAIERKYEGLIIKGQNDFYFTN
jgi:ATP-dependent DNA ligase